MKRTVDHEFAKNLYAEFESSLNWSAHYWLHRGALELENGNLDLAENFLSQATNIRPHDKFIQNEWAYLRFEQAIRNPSNMSSSEYVSEATATLEAIISQKPDLAAHAYHVLGRCGAKWAEVANFSPVQKQQYLNNLLSKISKAHVIHHEDSHLRQLLEELKSDVLKAGIS